MRELEESAPRLAVNWIKESKLNSAAQIAIYRGSMQECLTENLRMTFPVCNQLVGADYFAQLARAYIAKITFKQPDITYYGAHFSDFIQTALAHNQLDYLADVAAVEWACHLAQNGTAIPALDQAALAKVSQEALPRLTFALDKASTLFYSPYPILRIWQVNQADYQGEQQVDLSEGATYLLIHRRGLALCMTTLTTQAFKMLTYFSRGETFESVCQKCYEEYPEIEIPRLFAECIQQQYLVNFK